MNSVKLLDCTLRDGGYVNNWQFGESVILSVVNKLFTAGIDIIEGGYLSKKDSGSKGVARYKDIEDCCRFYLKEKPDGQDYAVMVNFGEFPIEELTPAEQKSPIIRVAFHKKDIEEAFVYLNQIEQLGYRYFIQPMGSMNYSDEEFVQLIDRTNKTRAEAFYIVDSFGVMEMKDFRRLLFLADNNLDKFIVLGYHAHNNLQQAYDNAKFMTEQSLDHDIIIDASVFGMGRGAGNLNIELFSEYLNHGQKKHYNIEPILEVYDEFLKQIYLNKPWGYSLPFYLSALHNCHPNYATYFSEKNTLSVKSMHELLNMISQQDKISYSKDKAYAYYKQYQANWIDDKNSLDLLKDSFKNRNILILAPGKSIKTYSSKIHDFIIKYNPLVIGVNRVSEEYVYDYLFVTNEKRLTKTKPNNVSVYIKTSNLPRIYDETIFVNYSSYLSEKELLADNPTLMLIQLLSTMGINAIHVAGFDGFSANPEDNYFSTNLSLGSSLETKIQKNALIKDEMVKLQQSININFLTPSYYLETK